MRVNFGAYSIFDYHMRKGLFLCKRVVEMAGKMKVCTVANNKGAGC